MIIVHQLINTEKEYIQIKIFRLGVMICLAFRQIPCLQAVYRKIRRIYLADFLFGN